MRTKHFGTAIGWLCAVAVTATSTSAPAQNASVTNYAMPGAGPAAAPAAPPPAAGANSTPQSVSTQMTNSDTNYLGDKFEWKYHAVTGWPMDMSSGSPAVATGSSYCIPAGTRVLATSSKLTTMTAVDGNQLKAGKSAAGTASTNYVPVVLDTDGFLLGTVATNPIPPEIRVGHNKTLTGAQQGAANSQSPNGACVKSGATFPDLAPKTQFYISEDDIEAASMRVGWDYGTLVVPFKEELSKGHQLLGSASLGAYLGYRAPFNVLDFQLSPVVFFGLSNVNTQAPTTSTSTTSSSTQTVAGLSYGFGVIASIKDSFHFGVVVGEDHVNTSQNYPYNDKPWISFELGYSFAQ